MLRLRPLTRFSGVFMTTSAANRKLERLTETLDAVAPVVGVSGTAGTRIDYASEATTEQRAAAESALAAFDWSDEAQAAWERGKRREAAIALLNSSEPTMVALRGFVTVLIRRFRVLLMALGLPTLTTAQLIETWADVIADGEVDETIPANGS